MVPVVILAPELMTKNEQAEDTIADTRMLASYQLNPI